MTLVPSCTDSTDNATPRSVTEVAIPDSKLTREATELARDTEPPLRPQHTRNPILR